jgi:penicillin-binding protein 2
VVVVIAVVVLLVMRSRGGKFTVAIGSQAPTAAGGSDTSTESDTKNRVGGLGVAVAGIVAVLVGKLATMQLAGEDEYAQAAAKNRTRTISTAAPRGRILDRNGVELVTNRPSLTVVADSSVASNDTELALLSAVLGMPKMAIKRNIQDTSEGAQSLRVVAVDVSRQVVAYIEEHPDLFANVSIEQRTARHYPYGSVGAHVLGYTGTVTTEQLNASSDENQDAITYQSGDITGQAGVEYQYESVLQGVRGEQTVYVDANGDVTGYSTNVPATAGSDVVLTLDINVQQAAESGLAHAIDASRKKGNTCNAGAVVVLDATNGDVLAMASAPVFDPGIFIGGISNDDWEALADTSAQYPLMNRGVSATYPSASTIKPISTFAALDYGIASIDSSYDCTGFWTGFGSAYGQYCWNKNGHGWMGLRSGIVYSCDTVFYEIGKNFYLSDNKEGLQATYRNWGLGATCGIDLPGEAVGRVPDAEWKWNYFSSYSDADRTWQGGDTTNLAIGQGDILVTPLQMACIYMGLANGGTIYKPHVLKQINNREGAGSVIEHKPEVLRTVVEQDAYFDLIHDALEGVIYEEDASVTAHFTNLPVTVAGKTGSGEKAGEAATGWFCAYAPAENPQYVVAAVVEQGGYGSSSAMYAVRDVLGALYNSPDTATSESSVEVR